MEATAVVMERPRELVLSRLPLADAGEADVVVDVEWSGISTGTERLLWSGTMPAFPGMGYPLVPGYETVGRITRAGAAAPRRVGERVFVPGARCFGDVRGLFGGAASRLVVPASRVVPISEHMAEKGVLLALAATAHHAIVDGKSPPQLIVGHGVLGRLIARVTVALGAEPPTVWEREPARREGAQGYEVMDPASDPRRIYPVICDVSGDASLLDSLIAKLAPGGEIVLAGFYDAPVHFAFAPAFMREARLRIAAQWRESDLSAVTALAESGALSLDGLITHRERADDAPRAYETAFTDPNCLKMILDWRSAS